MSSENYAIVGDQLILRDAELGLDLALPFSLPRLPLDLTAPKILEAGDLLVLERDQDGNLRAAFLTQGGKRHGQCRLFYAEGETQGEMFYHQGNLHGPSTFYGEGGELLSRIFFCNGKREGKGYLYFISGKPSSVQRFKNGVWDGLQEYFYETGMVKSVIPYAAGKLQGEACLFWENGQPKRTTPFLEGKREGIDRLWNEQGILIDQGEYHQGQPHGLHHHFFADGQRKEETLYHTPTRFDRKTWSGEGNLIYEMAWALDMTCTESVTDQTAKRRVRQGIWDGSKIRWK